MNKLLAALAFTLIFPSALSANSQVEVLGTDNSAAILGETESTDDVRVTRDDITEGAGSEGERFGSTLGNNEVQPLTAAYCQVTCGDRYMACGGDQCGVLENVGCWAREGTEIWWWWCSATERPTVDDQ